MTETEASAALSGRLNTLSGGHPVAWQNSPTFKPTVGVAWLAEFDLPANTDELALSGAGDQDKTAIYQVNVMTPVGEYRHSGNKLAESVKALFRGYRFQGLVVIRVQIETPNRDTDWWVTPVSVNYRVLF